MTSAPASPPPAGLFDPARHTALAAAPWDEAAARAAIARCWAADRAAWQPGLGWPAHPLDDPERPGQCFHPLYHGGGGVVAAWRHLARAGAVDGLPDWDGFVDRLPDRNAPELAGSAHGSASYLIGEAGLLLLRWRQHPDAATAERLHAVLRANLDNPVGEPLWGPSGTVLPAVFLAEATGEARWAALVRETVERLLDQMVPDPDTGTWLWQQQLYGQTVRYLGAGHGLAGNAFAALRGAAWLPAGLADAVLARCLATLQATALRDGPFLSWPAFVGAERLAGRRPLVQDCHGAPGIVTRLAGAPRRADWDALLLAAGELTWAAGPLAKGASLCHGTAGNGWALLKLWRRSGDARWLARARAFAMHAIAQVDALRAAHGQARHGLWTGDAGVACFVWACLSGDDAWPTLDRF